MRTSFFINLTLALSTLFSSAYATTLHCPNKIEINQSVRETIDAWDAFLDTLGIVHEFNRVTFYSGHPKERASLAPDKEDLKTFKLTWSFGKNTIWLACGYSNTTIQLIRKLPDHTKNCVVTYDTHFSKVIDINCI